MTHRFISAFQLFFAIFIFVACAKSKEQSVESSAHVDTPDRIVTLTPSATSLVVALGADKQIVGRDKYSVEPEHLRDLPVVGDFVSPNIEAIAALNPDLVIADESQEGARKSLETLEISSISLRMHTLSDVRTGLIEVGKSLKLEGKAQASLDKIDAKIAALRKRVSARSSSPRVLIIIDRDPDSLRGMIAAGPKTYIDELLKIVGAQNILADSPVQYPQIGAELIMRARPEIIIDLSRSTTLDAYQTIAEVPAVANKLVHLQNAPHLLTPSPNVGQALETLFKLTELPATE